ncbi:MAG: carboxypeptidase regulatory-like domain-containing protein, partial [Acidobacteriaceae bacterium]|nr:carboxypeptidase regulatory-like domain-containing protein [Acidobacteriaceae bacterium]
MSNLCRRLPSFVLLLLFTLPAGRLYSQTLFGRISGTVLDPTGAAIAGAHVTITDLEKQTSRVVSTDDKGFYSAENLPVGTYSVAADQS